MNIINLDAYRKTRQIEPYSVLAKNLEPEPTVWDKLKLRFKDNSLVLDLLNQCESGDHSEPYMFGDTSNCLWRKQIKGSWNEPIPFPCFMDQSTSVIGKGVKDGLTDPLAWMDQKYKHSLAFIQSKHGEKLEINTRSDLIATEEYLNALDKENHSIKIYVLNSTEHLNRILQPGAPSIKRLLTAYERLKSLGFRVSLIRIDLSVDGIENADLNIPCEIYFPKLTKTTIKKIKKELGIN